MKPAPLQLVDISELGLNSKIKKFSYSFICGKGYSPPSGENSFLSTIRSGVGCETGAAVLMIGKMMRKCVRTQSACCSVTSF